MSRTFGEIRQIAFVVNDIDRAMAYWSETLGVGPFFIKRNIRFVDYQYRGAVCDAPLISIALANSGFIQIELMQQHDDNPSIYKEFMQHGAQGLQHVAAWYDKAGFDHKRDELLAAGLKIAQQGTIASSGVRLVYFATDQQPGGLIFELADLLDPVHYDRIKNIRACAERWNGDNAIVDVDK